MNTKEELNLPNDESLMKKLKNRWYRLTHFYWIENKDGELELFVPNFFQRLLLINLHFRNIILKARQLGISTFIALLFLDFCLFKSHTKAIIVADKEENAKKIFAKILFAWNMFPAELKEQLGLRTVGESTQSLKFSNFSEISVGTTIHGGAYQLLHISELGVLAAESPDKAEKTLKSALPALSKKGLLFIESTAEGEDNKFHELWMKAVETQERSSQTGRKLNSIQLKPHFFPWWQHPEYRMPNDPEFGPMHIPPHLQRRFDEYRDDYGIELNDEQRNWYVSEEELHKNRMQEQYPSHPDEAFRVSGEKQFDPSIVKAAEAFCRPPINVHSITITPETSTFASDGTTRDPGTPIYCGDLLVWKFYQRGHRYGIGSDVSEGIGRDSSTAVVIDYTSNEVVATYQNDSIDPELLGDVLAYIGRMFGTPLIAPEHNNNGQVTCRRLFKIYPNVHKEVIQSEANDKKTNRLGFYTRSAAVKSDLTWGIDSALKAVPSLKIYDSTILTEIKAYRKADNLIVSLFHKTSSTRHFDLFMALAIAWKISPYAGMNFNSEEQEQRIQARRAAVQSGANLYT